MSAPQRPSAVRVKLPCEDEQDFFARLADAIAEKGLRIPTANLRPIGARVRLALEFRNAESISGEGIVDAHLEGARPTMNVRILRFERSRPAAAPVQARAGPPSPAAAPAIIGRVKDPSVRAPVPSPPRQEPPSGSSAPEPAGAPKTAAPAQPEVSFASLFAEEEEEEAQLVSGDAPDSEATLPIEPLRAGRAAAEPKAPVREIGPEPTPAPQTVAAPERTSRPAALAFVPRLSRRARVAAVAAAATLAVGLLAYSVARRPAAPARPPQPGPPAAASSDAQLAARIAAADRRVSDGRLAGPDGALDHLLAAKAIAPRDRRVKWRLEMLADTLERLGARAVERGDVAEAEVHLAAALEAAPDRASITEKLQALAKVPRAREARSRDRGAGRAGGK